MSGNELLELAAKAVGWACYRSKHGHWILISPDGDRYEYAANWRKEDMDSATIGDALQDSGWNPLNDDGDAFRLASKLNLTVEFGNNCVLGPVEVDGKGTDPLDATRLAIVLAAAEIGKAMSTAPEERS